MFFERDEEDWEVPDGLKQQLAMKAALLDGVRTVALSWKM
jgi:hypothetical protein